MLELAKPEPRMFKKKSLVILNMDWGKCDIDAQVTKASRGLNTLAEAMGAGKKIHFDLASPGAGEFILSRSQEKDGLQEETLDFLRQQHWEVRQTLERQPRYRAFRETSEMLQKLRARGHTLVAVFNGATGQCEDALCRSRLRDYFDDQVYGSDRGTGRFDASLYFKVLSDNDVRAEQVLIVEETSEGASQSSKTKANVAALITLSNCHDDEFRQRQFEMRRAGVTHIATTVHEVADLPDKIKSRQDMRAKLGFN